MTRRKKPPPCQHKLMVRHHDGSLSIYCEHQCGLGGIRWAGPAPVPLAHLIEYADRVATSS
jgi:hypothetical protein